MTATEETVAAAVIAALNTLNTLGAHAYDLDDLKALSTPPDDYTEVTVSRRFGGEERNTASTGRIGWRITTRAVAKTVTNARTLRERAAAALLYKRLTAGGDQTTPIQFESEDPVAEDEDWFSGLTTWTCVT